MMWSKEVGEPSSTFPPDPELLLNRCWEWQVVS